MSDTRNKILVRIVLAEGGTVRDPNVQKSLLEDILLARGVTPTAITRNGLLQEILQSYSFMGFLDVVPYNSVFCVSNQKAKSTYQGDNSDIEVLTADTTVGFLDNLFNGQTWDTATTEGANTANNELWYDQSGSGLDPVQATLAKKPEVDRQGTMDFTPNDFMQAPTLLVQPTTKFSGFVSIRIDDFATNQGIIAQDTVTGKRQWNFNIASSNKIKFTASIGSVFQTVTLSNASTLLVGRNTLGWSFDSITGITLYINGLPQVTTGGITGTFDTDTTEIALGSLTDGVFWPLDGNIDTASLWLDTLSDADHLAMHNKFIENVQMDMFLKGGQSNMVGNPTDFATVLPPLVAIDTGYFFDDATDETIPFVPPEGLAVGGSAMSSFCNEYYSRTGRKALIIEGAFNGSGMTVEGQGTNNWASGNHVYNTFLANGKAAEQATGLKIVGILWAQGEQDSWNITFGPNATNQTIYTAGFNDLLDRIDIEFPSAEFFISKLGNYTLTPSQVSDDMIRGVQDLMATQRSNVYIAFSGAVNFDAGVHYKQGEYNAMGTAMAAQAALTLHGIPL